MACCGDGSVEPGEPKKFDPKFKGPIKNRSCTDIICCLLFFGFVIGYTIIGLFAWLNGDPIILLNPTDNQGRICGLNYGDLDLTGKENVFYFDVTKCVTPSTSLSLQCPTTQICVPACPSTYWTYLPDVARLQRALADNGNNRTSAADNSDPLTKVYWENYICTYGFNARTQYIQGLELQTIISGGKCAPYYVPSTPVAGRCIPQVLTTAANYVVNRTTTVSIVSTELVDANQQPINGAMLEQGVTPIKIYLEAQEIAEKIFADFSSSWFWLLVGLAVAAVVSFIWIVIMRWFAGIIVWGTLITIIGLLSFGVWYCYDEWNRLKTIEGGSTSLVSVGFTTDLSSYLALQDTWLAFMIILAVLDVIIILLVIFLRKRIQIAIEIIRQASKAVGSMISTLFYPLVTFLLLLIVIAFWAATALFLASTGDPVYKIIDTRNLAGTNTLSLNGQSCNIKEWTNSSHVYYLDESVKCVFEKYGGESTFHQNVVWLQVVEAFGTLWLINWVLALGQMTLAGAFSSYYWSWKKPDDLPLLPVYSSIGRALRYHTGSLAFGSLIIAIVQFIRLILEYIDNKLKGAENKVAKFLICCCKCCFWCLENFLEFLNRNAYIMVAVYGKNFCWSAKEAFKLLLRNVLRVIVLDKVTGFILFIGKLVVALIMGAMAWAFFTNKFVSFSLVAPNVNYYWMMIVVIAISAYFVASGFFNTFGMAVDTIFLCFLEDLERNDGSAEKPYYMSKGLMKVLGKKNKKIKQTKE